MRTAAKPRGVLLSWEFLRQNHDMLHDMFEIDLNENL